MTGAQIQLNDQQRIAWLRLSHSENVGPATFRELINRYGSAQNALEILPELALRGGLSRHPRLGSLEFAENQLEQARKNNAHIAAIGEEHYPTMLKTMEFPPPLIYFRGDSAISKPPAVAIVGARNASLSGIKFARSIAHELGNHGYVIASGLARGIDAGAHQGALQSGTIGVLAGGLDCPYPKENIELFNAVIEKNGAVISEMPFGHQPRAKDFPRRNRLIVGLSLGVLVVEAAFRSGSLISARLAGEMGRILFAVPGSPLDPRTKGTNDLIKNGAILVTDAQDICEQLQSLISPVQPQQRVLKEPQAILDDYPPSDDMRTQIIQTLGQTPCDIDDIIAHTNATIGEVHSVVLDLELAGRIERHPGNRISILL